MLNMDDYWNNYEDAEAAEDSYDTYIITDLNLPDADGNEVCGRVKKRFRNDDGQAVDVVNRNPLIDRIKYEVEYLGGYVEEITTNQYFRSIV